MSIQKQAEVRNVEEAGDCVCFDVCFSVSSDDLPGVSVKGGNVFVVGAEQSVVDGERRMVFHVEAERAAAAWTVAITVQCGDVAVPLAGPLIKAQEKAT